MSQGGVTFEIIVVDDHSTDRTREIAAAFPVVRLVNSEPLRDDWTGKNNALVAGASVARGEWLLFTDADTFHLPSSLARSVAEAKRQSAGLLSYSPEQEVHGFSEKAIMPVIFAELALTYRSSKVSDPEDPAAAANGQYILVRRGVYDSIGGHAALATNLLEDVALAGRIKQSGNNIVFRYGDDAVRSRMYRSFGQLREGWTKNLALLFPASVRLAFARLLEFALIAASAGVLTYAMVAGKMYVGVAAAAIFAATVARFAARIRRAHFRWDSNLLAFFGLPVFSYLLLRSKAAHARGRVTWKGRTYSQRSSAPPGNKSPSLPKSGTSYAGQ